MYDVEKVFIGMLAVIGVTLAICVTTYQITKNNNDTIVYQTMAANGYEQVSEQGLGSWVWQKVNPTLQHESNTLTMIAPKDGDDLVEEEGI